MADVLTYPGMVTNGGVPAPYLQGRILSAGPGFGGRIALGMSPTTRRFADLYSGPSGVQISDAQMKDMLIASAQAAQQQPTSINFNYDVSNNIQQFTLPGQLYPQLPVSIPGQQGLPGAGGADGVDAFANIDIPIPYTGTATKWEECFTDNSPGAGSVAWATFKVKYKNVENTITAGNTANGWLYWSAAAPTVISTSATKPTLAAGQFLVGYNNAGTFEPSMFSKLITAGFLSVNALSAIVADLGTITSGTITLNLGSTYRLQISANGIRGSTNSGSSWFNIITLDGTDVVIQGTKLKLSSVGTTQISDGATKNWNATDGGNTSHTSDGGLVEVMGAAYWLASPGGGGTGLVEMYYNGNLIGSERRIINGGEYATFTFNGVGSGSGATAFTFTIISGLYGSASGVLYTRTMEDKGK